MTKTLAQIEKQIVKLQHEANSIKAKEVGAVVARIKEAITHYGLSAQDLGLTAKAGRKTAATAKPAPARKSARKTAAAKVSGPLKYTDGAGKNWTGRGKRPNWFTAALAAGKTAEDMLIKSGN